jgi:phage-related protein (TIGR01555 family)
MAGEKAVSVKEQAIINKLNQMDTKALIEYAAKMETRVNGWQNVITGLGMMGRDKRTGANMSYRWLTEIEAELLYAGDKMARRLVELLPSEALREWITFHGFDAKILSQIIKDLESLQLPDFLWQGATFARTYGGAGTWVMVDDGEKDLSKPLILSKVKKVIGLWTFSRFELQTLSSDIETDVNNPNFGRANFYMLTPRNRIDQNVQSATGVIKFHHTRIIRWNGAQLPRRLWISNQYWDDSILTPFKQCLEDYKMAVGSIAAMIQDFRVAILKIKGLADAIASGNEDYIKTRMNQILLSRSVIGATMMDAENEEFKYDVASVEGIEKLVQEIKFDLQSTTDYPAEILFNESPSGGIGSGAGDAVIRRWYDRVGAEQRNYFSRPLNRFLEIYFAASEGPMKGKLPEAWSYTWNSLYKMTDLETSQARYQDAQSDAVYLTNGVLTPEIVLESRFGGDEYGHDIELPDGYLESMTAGTPSDKTISASGTPDTAIPADGDPGSPQTEIGKKMSEFWLQDSASGSLQIQTVIVAKDHAGTLDEAKALAGDLLKKNGADETSMAFRFHQRDPAEFVDGSLKTKVFKPGLSFVFGILK